MLDSVINPVHLMIILAVVVVLFGPKRLPEMGQKIGQALREFKSATSEIRAQIGADEIADSVKDIKSTFSLTGDSPRSADEIAPDATGATAPDATGTTADGATAPDATGATAPAAADGPAGAAPDVTAVPAAEAPAGELATGPIVAAGAPGVDRAAGDDEPLAATAADEGGVEAFGSLQRSSASSPVRAAGD